MDGQKRVHKIDGLGRVGLAAIAGWNGFVVIRIFQGLNPRILPNPTPLVCLDPTPARHSILKSWPRSRLAAARPEAAWGLLPEAEDPTGSGGGSSDRRRRRGLRPEAAAGATGGDDGTGDQLVTRGGEGSGGRLAQ